MFLVVITTIPQRSNALAITMPCYVAQLNPGLLRIVKRSSSPRYRSYVTTGLGAGGLSKLFYSSSSSTGRNRLFPLAGSAPP